MRNHPLFATAAAIAVALVSQAASAQVTPITETAKPRCTRQPAGSPVRPSRKFDDIEPQHPTHKLENPLRRGVRAPLKMLAFGDSAMWGNGLNDAHKYAHLVAQYVSDGTGRTVKLTSYAHSGANIADEDACYAPTIDSDNGVPPGDLSGGLPTVLQQEGAAARVADYRDTELVLLDGCINDVNPYRIVFPLSGMNPAEVRRRAHLWCSDNMLKLLQLTEKDFPFATVIVSNYWLIISDKSKPAGLAINHKRADFTPSQRQAYGQVEDLLAAELKAEKEAGRQVTDERALADPRATFQKWSDNSYAFLETTETCFDWAVASVDNKTTKPNDPGADACPNAEHVGPQLATPTVRAFLAKVSCAPQYSYGAGKDTRLWSVRGLLGDAKDQVYQQRSALCESHYDNAPDDFLCHVNPTAHPNVPGADAYGMSIEEILAAAWGWPLASPVLSAKCM